MSEDYWEEQRKFREEQYLVSKQHATEEQRKRDLLAEQQRLQSQEWARGEQLAKEYEELAAEEIAEQALLDRQAKNDLLLQRAQEWWVAEQALHDAARQLVQAEVRAKTIGSPVENAVWEQWNLLGYQQVYPLFRQHPIGKRRVDFAYPPLKIAIEVDSYKWHFSNRVRQNQHYTREQELKDLGWEFIRFTGSQAHWAPEECATYLFTSIQERANKENGKDSSNA